MHENIRVENTLVIGRGCRWSLASCVPDAGGTVLSGPGGVPLGGGRGCGSGLLGTDQRLEIRLSARYRIHVGAARDGECFQGAARALG